MRKISWAQVQSQTFWYHVRGGKNRIFLIHILPLFKYSISPCRVNLRSNEQGGRREIPTVQHLALVGPLNFMLNIEPAVIFVIVHKGKLLKTQLLWTPALDRIGQLKSRKFVI